MIPSLMIAVNDFKHQKNLTFLLTDENGQAANFTKRLQFQPFSTRIQVFPGLGDRGQAFIVAGPNWPVTEQLRISKTYEVVLPIPPLLTTAGR
jgi:hypothetical protein